MMGYGRYGYGVDMMGGSGWLGALLMFVFIALVIAGLVLIVLWIVRSGGSRGAAGGSMPPSPPMARGEDEAMAIARRRLASGEITKEQYDEIVRALNG